MEVTDYGYSYLINKLSRFASCKGKISIPTVIILINAKVPSVVWHSLLLHNMLAKSQTP